MRCPKCGTESPEGAHFCEIDGTPLAGSPSPAVGENSSPAPLASPTCRCGAGVEARDEQGFCGECGRRREQQTLPLRDHLEIELSPTFAGVTDRGRRHAQNEDAMALAQEEIGGQQIQLLIVCDGVSSSGYAAQASETAANATRGHLLTALRAGETDAEKTLREAIYAANEAVCALYNPEDTTREPPETTLVAALVQGSRVTVAWVGDSRAYFITANEAIPLTRDHSWLNEMTDSGAMTYEEILHSPYAHAITRCLGPVADNEAEDTAVPSVAQFTIPPACRLLLCSDGLWNYIPDDARLAALVQDHPSLEGTLPLTRSLVDYANRQGGRDNITVAVAQF